MSEARARRADRSLLAAQCKEELVCSPELWSTGPLGGLFAVCIDLLTVPASSHTLAPLINYEVGKPVRIRRGRATVIEPRPHGHEVSKVRPSFVQ
jgi:hypothetical protein